MLGKLLHWMTTAAVLGCVATVAVEAAGVGLLWSRGMLASDRLVKYAGILYGLDPLDLDTSKTEKPEETAPESREQNLANRVRKTPQLVEREAAASQSTDDIRGVTLNLKRNREKFVAARESFESLLDQLESEIAANALREVQVTLEAVSPKQAKEILRAMLTSGPADGTDSVMSDVVRMVKSIPDNRLTKILAEFKTEEERVLLHRILVEIGELDPRTAQRTRTEP